MSPPHKLMPTEEMIEAGELEMLDAFYEAEQYDGYRKPRATPPDAFDLRILKGLRAVLAMSAARPTTDDGLVERLRSRGTFAGAPGFLHNPDGPEAADRITALHEALRRFVDIVDGTEETGFDPHVEQMLMDAADEARKALETLSNGGGI